MFTRFKIFLLFCFGTLLLLSSLFLWALESQSKETEIVFLDVGQGDAILVSQGRNQVLIDGGRSGKDLLSRLGRHIPFWDRRIEVVIATHPDADHIGGFASLFQAYRVAAILSTGVTSDTEVVKYTEEIRKQFRQPEIIPVIAGSRIEFPLGGELSFLYPHSRPPERVKDTNATSMVTRFQYGDTSFLLTGDLAEEEKFLPQAKEVTVLKAAHHGSKYSTSEAFLKLIRPKEAVISVGENTYGHPTPEVLERLRQHEVIIRRTDEIGDVRYRCEESEGTHRCVYQP